MSYDTILNTLGTVGTGAKAIGSGIGDTLLGQSPRTGSVGQFTGDTLHSLGDPHGLLGQALRVAGVVAGFSHSPQAGLAMLDAFNKGDQQRSSELGTAAAMQQTPTQFEQQYGYQPPKGTQLAPVDMPSEGSLPSPSAPEQ